MFSEAQMVKIRTAVESLYDGRMSIIQYDEITDPETKITDSKEVVKAEGIKCRLSFKSVSGTNEDGEAATVQQVTKVFTSPDIKIPPGSKLVITQNGITREYEQSGEPAVYSSHQEIVVNLFKGWA